MADSRSVVIEIYLALERATGEGNIQKARKAARAAGFSFTNGESAKWLRPFTEAAAKRRAAPVTAPVTAPVLSTKRHLSGHPNGLARVIGTPSLIPLVDSLRSSTCAAKPHTPRQGRLDFDREFLDKRKAILKAVYQRVQPYLHRATTQGDWFKRNAATAGSFVKGNISPEQAVAAWDQALRVKGEPYRQLALVQKFLDEIATSRAQRAKEALEA